MSIRVLIDPPKEVRPAGAIRADVAWKLYLPDSMGDIPKVWMEKEERFKYWLWTELSDRLGFLKEHEEGDHYILTPDLTAAGEDFIARTCSLWSNHVYIVRGNGSSFDLNREVENSWVPPLVNIFDPGASSETLKKIIMKDERRTHFLLSPILGSGRTNMRVYEINPGHTFARYHSHTAREELYLVLEGKGSARIAGYKIDVRRGDLIAKPTGPDIATQLLADKGEPMRVLDVEIWPHEDKQDKDLVRYPDHGELDLFGPGWEVMLPSESVMSLEDSLRNYHSGYVRKSDGSWEPRELPGYRKRER